LKAIYAEIIGKELKYMYGVGGWAEIPRLIGHRHWQIKKWLATSTGNGTSTYSHRLGASLRPIYAGIISKIILKYMYGDGGQAEITR